MAIAATAVINNPNYKSWTVTCLDADTTVNLAHGFGLTPDYCVFQELSSTMTNAVDAHWQVVPGATNIVISKLSTTGSGGTTPGTTVVGKIFAMTPHSIMQ